MVAQDGVVLVVGIVAYFENGPYHDTFAAWELAVPRIYVPRPWDATQQLSPEHAEMIPRFGSGLYERAATPELSGPVWVFRYLWRGWQ